MADPTLKIVGDSDKAQAAIVALEKKLDKVQNQLRHVSKNAKVAGSATTSGMNAALSATMSYAGGFVSLAAAAGAANKVLMENQRIRDEAARKGVEAVPGLAKLAQIAIDPAHHSRLIQDSEKMLSLGIGKSLNEAADFIFSMESGSIRGADRDMLTGLAANQVIGDASQFTAVLKSLQTAIGKQETGSLTDIASKAFAASGHALATVEELLQAASRGGTSAAALGMRDEEVLAATAVLSNASNASEAGTQVKALLASLQNRGGFAGQGLSESLQSIAGQGMDDAQLNKFFGSSESAAGFRVLTGNLEAYAKALEDIDTAVSRNLAQVKINMPMQIPQIAAALESTRAGARLDVSRTDQGTLANLADAMQTELVRSAENGYGFGMLESVAGGTNRFMLGDEVYLNEPRNRKILADRNPELLQQILTTLQRMEAKAAEQLTETRQQRPARVLRRNEQ